VSRAELGVQQVGAVDVRIAEVLRRVGEAVEFVQRTVVTEPVATVVGEPELAGVGVPVEAVPTAVGMRTPRATISRPLPSGASR
jgi:hypothetical protein